MKPDSSYKVNNHLLAGRMAMAQGIEPQDEVEGMLAVQMAAIHSATMTFAERLSRSTTVAGSESYERSLNRLARTFTAQIEALKRYRAKGEQRVVVEHQHVHVYPGGQAVVGTVNQGGGRTEIEDQCHGRNDGLRLSERAAVLGALEADGLPLPGAGADGQERVPVPRRKGRRSNGAG
jgi:hypothetical protein